MLVSHFSNMELAKQAARGLFSDQDIVITPAWLTEGRRMNAARLLLGRGHGLPAQANMSLDVLASFALVTAQLSRSICA